MAKLPDKFSIGKPVVIDPNGHPVRPVDVNGVALDDSTTSFSEARPVIEVDSTGTAVKDSTQVFSTARKVKIDPTGHPVITIGAGGTSLGGTIGATANLYTYDTTIGNGVDSSGFASLPLNTGAKRIYLNNSTGLDTNSGLTSALPVATLSHALSLVTAGNGDQILVAEGTTGYDWPNYSMKSGASPTYPMVVQSYPPSDPTNESKLGRATGSNRPVVTTTSFHMLGGSGTSPKYMAIRGMAFNPGNVGNAGVTNTPNATGNPDYVLNENNVFAYAALSFDVMGAGNVLTKNIIIRNCAIYGQWGSNRAQGIYINAVDGLTVEDCIFYNNGWEIGGSRSSDPSLGGSSNQSHAMYIQDTVLNAVCRRNVTIASATEAANFKGGGILQWNLSLRNPIFLATGSGNNYSVDAPFGVYSDIGFNAAIGTDNITGSTPPMAWGIHTSDGRVGSLVRNNLLIHSGYTTSGYAYMDEAPVDFLGVTLPSYTTFENNVAYLWNPSGLSYANGISGTTDKTQIHTTLTNNAWDDPTSGTNVNSGTLTFANAYTEATLLAALGYPDETTAINDWIAHPEQHGWRNGVSLLLAGYGITTSGLQDLTTNMAVTVGIPSSGQFMGTQDGTTLTATMPSGFTLNNGNRSWHYDGTGTTGSGSVVINESNGTTSHNSTISWSLSPQPVLSSLTTSSTTTATVSTNTGSGMLYWEQLASTDTPAWPWVRAGYRSTGQVNLTTTGNTYSNTTLDTLGSTIGVVPGVRVTGTGIPAHTYVVSISGTTVTLSQAATATATGVSVTFSSAALSHGSQVITSTGTQTITGIGTMQGGDYLYVVQVDAGGNPSAVSSVAYSAIWTPASLPGLTGWYEAAAANTFVDLGVTAVSSDGQAIEQVNDKSGLGNNLTQTILSHRPTWFSNAGKPYWRFVSTSAQELDSAAGLTLTDANGQWWAAIAISFDTASTLQIPIGIEGTGRVGWLYNSGSGVVSIRSYNNTGSSTNDNAGTLVSGTPAVMIGTVTTTAAESFLDNVSNGSTALTGTRQSNAATLYLGEAKSTGQWITGNVYGVVIGTGTLSSTDRANLQTYMAALHP